jgi:hypothetical protein
VAVIGAQFGYDTGRWVAGSTDPSQVQPPSGLSRVIGMPFQSQSGVSSTRVRHRRQGTILQQLHTVGQGTFSTRNVFTSIPPWPSRHASHSPVGTSVRTTDWIGRLSSYPHRQMGISSVPSLHDASNPPHQTAGTLSGSGPPDPPSLTITCTSPVSGKQVICTRTPAVQESQ